MTEPPVPSAPPTVRYGVVVPVKRLAVAKSRLAPLGDELRRDLVAAFAIDTALAALDSPVVAAVLVVTDDVPLARSLRDLGVEAIPDGHAGRLNESLVEGAAELLRRHPTLRPVALCGDLPCLRPDDLARALVSTPSDRAGFVPDAAGTGTTLFTAPTYAGFAPRFGEASRQAHRAAGAAELVSEAPASVRRDVDTPEDLREAVALGVGPRTAWVVTSNPAATTGTATAPRT